MAGEERRLRRRVQDGLEPTGTSQARRMRRSSTGSSRGDRTRGDILAAALTVFSERGFAETRISDIVHEAGMAQGTFYTYFASKNALFKALVLLGHQDVLETSADEPPECSQPPALPHSALLAARRRVQEALCRLRDVTVRHA